MKEGMGKGQQVMWNVFCKKKMGISFLSLYHVFYHLVYNVIYHKIKNETGIPHNFFSLLLNSPSQKEFSKRQNKG